MLLRNLNPAFLRVPNLAGFLELDGLIEFMLVRIVEIPNFVFVV